MYNEGYGRITAVGVSGGDTVITFLTVTKEEIETALSTSLNYYQEQDVDFKELEERGLIDLDQIAEEIEAQAERSGFVDKASEQMVALAMTPEIKAQLRAAAPRADGGPPVKITGKTTIATIWPETKYIPNQIGQGGFGLRCTLQIKFTIEFEDIPGLKIPVQADFVEEFSFKISISGDTIWAYAWIFPYIQDYQINVGVDFYNYSFVSAEASAKIETPDADIEGEAGMILDIAEEMTSILNNVLEFEQRDGVRELYEIYGDMMEDAGQWEDLVKKQLFKLDLSLFLGIVVVRVEVNLVIKVDVQVTIGSEFSVLTGDRYNFWIRVFSATAGSNTTRLINQEILFNAYVMGRMGLRAGAEIKVYVGLFSLNLAKVGIEAEAGIQLRLYGFFIYELQVTNGKVVKSGASGAVYFDIGLYVEVFFVADAGNGKYSYRPAIYDKYWPLYKAGAQNVVYDFTNPDTYNDESAMPLYKMKGVQKTLDLPADLLRMDYLDLVTGKAVAKNYEQKYFDITFTDPAFSMNSSGQIQVNPPKGVRTLDAKMMIRFKNQTLAFTTLPITRTVRLHWDDLRDAGYTISFDSLGGSYIPGITQLYNTAVTAPATPPTWTGYTFDGWYTERACLNPYTFDKMPGSDVILYAKWTPATDTPYTVRRWQEALTGDYVLVKTDASGTGATNASVNPPVETYEGFTSPKAEALTIQADGTAVLDYRYPRNSYTVTFDDYAIQVKYGATIHPPTAGQKEGHTYLGWAPALETTMPAKNLDYTSNWKINSYTVNFRLDGQTYGTEQTYEFGATLELPAPEAVDLKRFSGWHVDEACTIPFTGKTMPSKALLLYGKLIDNAASYTVQHHQQNVAGDGYDTPVIDAPVSVTKGTSVTPAVKECPGFVKPDTQTVTVNEAMTIDYYYDRQSYSITFAADAGGVNGRFKRTAADDHSQVWRGCHRPGGGDCHSAGVHL